MMTTHPYKTWPLHVKLFTPEVVKVWEAASRSGQLLPPGSTVQIELEGVDGKSGQAGSGRSGPIEVTDSTCFTPYLIDTYFKQYVSRIFHYTTFK